MSNPNQSTSTTVPRPLPAAGAPDPVVSICCITYNHERFIDQALDGFLGQQTSFPVEIIVHDDASTDRTAEILRERIDRHSGRVRAVLRTENQHRHGRGIMPMFAEWARGEFIAVCEGDDYWTAPDKLETQVAYMQANPDCIACCHDSIVVDEKGGTVAESYFRPSEEKFTQADVIGTLLSREPTCSLLFRRSAFLPPLPSWYLRRPSDLYLDILITEHGRLGFIDRTMAAYRVHAGGVWSGEREASRLVELIVRYKFVLSDAGFFPHYRELLLLKIAEFEAQLFTRADSRNEISRLERIVEEQSASGDSSRRENQRLAQRERELQAELERARAESQLHIDALKAQLDRTVATNEKTITGLRIQLEQLAATSQQQTTYIATLRRERDRLSAETTSASSDAAAARAASQRHIDALKIQLDRTVAGYEESISSLLSQIGQTVQRNEAVLVPLREQVLQLASTSRQQAAHISALEQERDRLLAREKQLSEERSHYLNTMDEQSRYIKALEAERLRLAADSSAPQ